MGTFVKNKYDLKKELTENFNVMMIILKLLNEEVYDYSDILSKLN